MVDVPTPLDPYEGIRQTVGPVFLDQASRIVADYRQHAEGTGTTEVVCFENMNVCLIVPSSQDVNTVASHLQNNGHHVRCRVGTVKEALQLIPSLPELGVDLIVMDDFGSEDNRTIMDAIRIRHGSNIPCASLSPNLNDFLEFRWTSGGLPRLMRSIALAYDGGRF